MITAAEFLTLCSVFNVKIGGGSISIPVSMGQGGTGAILSPSVGSLFVSGASHASLLPTSPFGLLATDGSGNPSITNSLPSGLSIPGYLALSGGTMTGNLILNGDPTNPLQAATKQFVESIADGLHAHWFRLCSVNGRILPDGHIQTGRAVWERN